MSFEKVHDFGSEFSDYGSESENAKRKEVRKKDEELMRKPNLGHLGLLHSGKTKGRAPSKRLAPQLLDKEEGKRMRYHGLLAMDAYNRHRKFVNDYLFLYGGQHSDFKRDTSKDKTDADVIRENHRFLWDDEVQETTMTWEQKLAKKYWDKLFKEYAICDLTRYKENKVAMRWRTEKEVIAGKGQFSCGNKHCKEEEGLRSWEVNFAYMEAGTKKNALIKLRLCPECSYKLNYHHKKREVTKKLNQTKDSKRKKKKKHRKYSSDSDDDQPRTSKSSQRSASGDEDDERDMWSKPLQIEEDKSREEEFDDYFHDLFL